MFRRICKTENIEDLNLGIFYFICFFISLRNKTKLHVNLTHDFNSSSAAIQVTLLIEVSFKGELSSFIVTPESKNPDVLQGSNIEVMLFLGKSMLFLQRIMSYCQHCYLCSVAS